MVRSPGGAPRQSPKKRTIEYAASILLMALVLIPAPAAATVSVSDSTVTPAVLMPGDEGTITVVLTNVAPGATGSALNVQVDSEGVNVTQEVPGSAYIESVLIHSKDVVVLSGSYQDIGEIGPGQSIPLTFRIRAPGEEGIYFPEVWVRVRGAAGMRYPVPVNVNSAYALIKRPALRVERTVPAAVDPGDPFTITLTLLNEGQAGANDISVHINASPQAIAPKASENYYVPKLDPGEELTYSIPFETDVNAPLGLEPIFVVIDYLSADLTPFQQVSTIGVPIVGRADMGVASVRTEPSLVSAGDRVDLTIRIENTGTADARSVRATIDDLNLSGTKEAFLGTIEPGNDGPAVFSLQTEREGDYPYALTIRYSDDYGTHTARQPLRMVVAEADTIPTFAIVVVVVIVAVAVAIFWYRRQEREE